MDISLTNRLSFKQAAATVLAAFIIGTLLAMVQVAADYANEDAAIDRQIQALLQISHSPASRIAYNLDEELAQELLNGLLASPTVVNARLVDNAGNELARASRTLAEGSTRLISDLLFGARRNFESRLYMAYQPDETLGQLELEVDTYAFGDIFLRRAGMTLLAGFARSLLLSLVLLVLFYGMLTKPLSSLARDLSSRDPRSGPKPLPCPEGHEKDEIGVLVEAVNQQLARTSVEIDQRREAEDRLTRYLSELESIVSARTGELETANARLTRSNQELQQARQIALDMAQARSSFLATMSHEIRTPLNGLLGLLSLSLDGALSAEQRQQLSVAHDSGKVLVQLLNDILDLSKFDAGALELEQLPFDPGVLVEDTASLLSQSASPGVELTCLIDPALPSQVLGDQKRVRQVLGNLLSNALKFTRYGRVDVRAEYRDGNLRLSVVDTGIGMSEETQARIFQPFTQADASIAREYGGTGLGLTLTRRLCEAMGGRLELQSREGFGTRFDVCLPLPCQTMRDADAALQGKVILLSEGRSGLHELLGIWLPQWGLDLERRDVDAGFAGVTCDILMTDCADCLYELRPHLEQPMLLVTAYGSFLSQQQAQTLQPLEQLPRPLSRQALYLALQRALQTPQTAVTEAPRMDLAGRNGRVLLVEDNPVNQMVARGMLARSGCEVLVANDGRQALELLSAGEAIDLVLMDCNMPVMNGYEASRRIRMDGRWNRLPIIALTANAMPDERDRCRSAGMSDYLAKPFRREELVAMLDTWLPAESA